MDTIRIYRTDEIEYFKLKIFIDAVNDELENLNNTKLELTLKNTFFDYGQNWMYTAPIVNELESLNSITGSWQALCPRDYKLILASDSFKEIQEMGKYFAQRLDVGKISIHLYEVYER